MEYGWNEQAAGSKFSEMNQQPPARGISSPLEGAEVTLCRWSRIGDNQHLTSLRIEFMDYNFKQAILISSFNVHKP